MTTRAYKASREYADKQWPPTEDKDLGMMYYPLRNVIAAEGFRAGVDWAVAELRRGNGKDFALTDECDWLADWLEREEKD